ncbi:MAG: hypothetical protein ABIJ57_01430 [Pseudomonadota bacterium]
MNRWDGVTSTFTRETSTGSTITLGKIGVEVDALQVYGAGVNYTDATIISALTAIGTTNKVALVLRPGTWTVSANRNWSAYTNVTFRIPPGVLISHGAYTLNIPNPEAGPYQWLTGAGAVTFTNAQLTYPQWEGGSATAGPVLDKALNISAATAIAARAALSVEVKGTHIYLGDYPAVKGDWNGSTGTDDTAAIQALIDGITTGGVVVLDPTKKYLIDNNLTVGVGVTLQGAYQNVGNPGTGNLDATKYASLGSALYLNSAKTISLSSMAGLKGLAIFRKGITFPEADAALFAGTAVTLAGEDTYVGHCGIYGFNKGVYAVLQQRVRIEYLQGDNVNGIHVDDCADTAQIFHCHFWPFITVASAMGARTGTGISLTTNNDSARIGFCTVVGYAIGFSVNVPSGVIITGCNADGAVYPTAAYGYRILGASQDNQIIGCQASGYPVGFQVATDADKQTTIIGGGTGTCTSGITLASGNLNIIGVELYGSTYGFTYSSTDSSSKGLMVGCSFPNTGTPILVNYVGPRFVVGDNFWTTADGGNVTNAGGSLTVPTVASATALLLPGTGRLFHVSGTTDITSIQGNFWPGRQVTLIFDGILTFTDGSNLKLAGNLVSSGDDTITLQYDGANWYEVCRSVN